MAKDYIEREAAIMAIESVPDGNWRSIRYAKEVKAIPAADVVPVVRGRWVGVYNDLTCSVCNKRWDECRTGAADDWGYWAENPSFCPNCGARMEDDGE